REKLPKQFAIAKLFNNSGLTDVINIRYLNPYKLKIEVSTEECAGKLLDCQEFQTKGWKIYSAMDVNISYGIIRDVDLELSDEEALKAIKCPNDIEIISLKRLQRRDGDTWVPSEVAKVGFKGSYLPKKRVRELMAEYNCTYQVACNMYVRPRLPINSQTVKETEKPKINTNNSFSGLLLAESESNYKYTPNAFPPLFTQSRSKSPPVSDNNKNKQSHSQHKNKSVWCGHRESSDRIPTQTAATDNVAGENVNNTRETHLDDLITRLKDIIFMRNRSFLEKFYDVIKCCGKWLVIFVVDLITEWPIANKCFEQDRDDSYGGVAIVVHNSIKAQITNFRLPSQESIPNIKICEVPSTKFVPKSYWSSELSRAVAERRLALAQLRKNPTPTNFIILKQKVARAQRLIRRQALSLFDSSATVWARWYPVASSSWGVHPVHLRRLYIAIIRSRLDYGCFLFDNSAKTNIYKLDKIQNQAMRVYSDGSKVDNATGAAFFDPQSNTAACFTLNCRFSVMAAELCAISECLSYLTSCEQTQCSDPVSVGAHSSADSREGLVSTAMTPRDDTDEDVCVVERTTRVTLAGVLATNVKNTSADHILSNSRWRVQGHVASSTQLIIDTWTTGKLSGILNPWETMAACWTTGLYSKGATETVCSRQDVSGCQDVGSARLTPDPRKDAVVFNRDD
ncbi:hypothetical protein HW555_011387, partial [Spodoptera exigua]